MRAFACMRGDADAEIGEGLSELDPDDEMSLG